MAIIRSKPRIPLSHLLKHSPIFSLQNCQVSLSTTSIQSRFSQESHCRKQILISSLLQRYGFPSSLLPNFLPKNRFLIDSDLKDIENSLRILLFTFKIPQSDIMSLVRDCPRVLDSRFLKNWESGLSKLGLSRVPPLMIRSVLQHSRRFQLGAEGVFRSVVVLKGLGFSHGTLTKVLEGFPGVTVMNEREIQRRIDFMIGIPVAKDGIEWIVRCFPEVLGFGIEYRLKPLLSEFKDLGFSEDLISREIVREPRILGLEIGELSRCLELLRSLKCREVIKEKIFSEGEFRAGFEVKLRVDYLSRQGLNRREALEVLWKEPRSILYKMEDIERKVEFLVNDMRYTIRYLLDVPEYMGVNFDKQIVPRFNVIKYLKSKDGLSSEVGLKALIKPSRLKFYNLYVKPYPECKNMYGRYLVGEVKSRHPVGLWKHFKPQSVRQTKEDVRNMKLFMSS